MLSDISQKKQILFLAENLTVFRLRKTEKEFVLLQAARAVEM